TRARDFVNTRIGRRAELRIEYAASQTGVHRGTRSRWPGCDGRASPPPARRGRGHAAREGTMADAVIDKVRLFCPLDEVEAQALAQIRNIASLPWVFHHVAVMPDVHYGMGATVGS